MFKLLKETDDLRLEHEFELVQLIQKSTGKVLFTDDFYGDPQASLIINDKSLVVVGGEHLTIWTPNLFSKITKLKNIQCLRETEIGTIEILIDPWSENSSVWELETVTFQISKLREFPDYRNKPYTDNIIW